MKSRFFVFLLLSVIILLTACSSQSEQTGDVSETENGTGFFGLGGDSDEEIEDEIEDYPFFAESLENIEDTVSIKYIDDGVHIDFTGSNEFGDGYAFIPNTTLITGTADYFEKDNSNSSSSQIYVYEGMSDLIISSTDIDPHINGIAYDRDYSRVYPYSYSYITSRAPKLWIAEGAEIENIETGDVEEIEGALTEMTTVYRDDELIIEITGTGETTVIDNLSATLTGVYLLKGSNGEYDIEILMDRSQGGIVMVTLISEREKTKFEFKYEDISYETDYEYSTNPPTGVGLEVVYNQAEYDVPEFKWGISDYSKDWYYCKLQVKIQDGIWYTIPYGISQNYDEKYVLQLNRFVEDAKEFEDVTIEKITEARVAFFPANVEIDFESYNFTKGEDWIECDISYNTNYDDTELVIERTSGMEEFYDNYNLAYYKIYDLIPFAKYDFSAEIDGSGNSSIGVTDEEGSYEIYDYDSDASGTEEEWEFGFSNQSTGKIVSDVIEYVLSAHIVEIGEEENGVTPYSVTKHVHTNFYLNTDNVDVDGLEEMVEINTENDSEVSNILTSIQNRRDTIEVRYEDDLVYLDFTGSNIFGDGYAVIPNSSVIINSVAPFYPDDDSIDSMGEVLVNLDMVNYDNIKIFFEDDISNYVEYQVSEEWREAMDKEFVGEEGVSQSWSATKANIITGENTENESIDEIIDVSGISATSVSQNGEIHFNINGIDDYMPHSEAIFTGYNRYSYLFEKGSLGTDYISIPFYAYFENDVLIVEINYYSRKLIIEFEK